MTINSVAGRAFVSHGNCKLITSHVAIRYAGMARISFFGRERAVFLFLFFVFAMNKRWYCVRLVLDEARFVQIKNK